MEENDKGIFITLSNINYDRYPFFSEKKEQKSGVQLHIVLEQITQKLHIVLEQITQHCKIGYCGVYDSRLNCYEQARYKNSSLPAKLFMYSGNRKASIVATNMEFGKTPPQKMSVQFRIKCWLTQHTKYFVAVVSD